MRRLLKASLLAAMGWAVAAPASADTLTINGDHGDVWTLDVETGCTSGCSVTLTGDLGSDTFFDGKFVDAVQWTVDGGTPTAVTLTDAPGSTAAWNPAEIDSSLSGGNQCNGSANDNVCVDTVAALGVAVNSGDVLTWTFLVDWDTALPADLGDGNIRASFNDASGTNKYTFSPSGGTFETTDNVEFVEQPENVEFGPEPATLVLFGSGLAIAAARLRRRRQNENA